MEKILVVKRPVLFKDNYFNGFAPAESFDYKAIILKNYKFLPRKDVENNPFYQQIIPYCIFKHGKRVFLYKRLGKNELRLTNKYSIGIGGHINPIDRGKDILLGGAKREFHEELNYNGKYSMSLLGFINDDSNSVGKVHFGIAYLIEGSTPSIDVSEQEKHLQKGCLVDIDKLKQFKNKMEIWSRIVMNNLINNEHR